MKAEVAYLVGTLFGVFLFVHPVNIWLARRVWDSGLFAWSLFSSFSAWNLYRALGPSWRESRPMLLISVVVLAAVLVQLLAFRVAPTWIERVPEERRLGWALFSGVMTLAVVIFVPLGAALFLSMFR